MARKTVTEEELGLAPTEEEIQSIENEPEIGEDEVIEGQVTDDGLDKPNEQAEAEKPAEAAEEKPEDTKTVDLRALQEARAEAREARENARVLEQRWNEFLATQNAPKEEAKPEIPKWDDDPMKAGQWTQEQIIAMREAQESEQRERDTAQRQRSERERMMSDASAEYQSALQSDPTVGQAYEALVESFRREAAFYPGMTQQQRNEYMANTEAQHIAYARHNNIPIADYIKGLAGARGWQPSAQPAPEAQKPKTDLAAVAEAQQRHQSLSDAPGGDAPAPLDAKALAKMTDKQFKDWISKKGNEQKFDEIMGG